MRNSKGIFILMVVAVLAAGLFLGCGGNGDGEGDAILGTPSQNPGTTIIRQQVPVEDEDYGTFVGYANYWDLYNDFSISDGNDDQFDGALELTVGSDEFPEDQSYLELTWMTPDLTSADGLPIPAVADSVYGLLPAYSGTYALYLPGGPEESVFQDLDLSAAAGTVSLQWRDYIYNYDSSFDDDPSYGYNVVLMSADTSSHLETLFSFTSDYAGWTPREADLTDYAGEVVRLAFQFWGSGYGYMAMVVVDDVSVTDTEDTDFVANGGFEEGDLTGWNYVEPVYSTNITSGARTLDGLSVTRSFFTYPNQLWGRMVDVFENTSGEAIATTVEYYTNLGSDNYGIIYYSPDTGERALTTWDGSNSDRDIGFVFGIADEVEFTSDTKLGGDYGDDSIYHRYGIDVPAGGKVAIVNFVIMTGQDTGETATDIDARATLVDEAAKDIVDNFWDDGIYRDGMTQEQIDAVINF